MVWFLSPFSFYQKQNEPLVKDAVTATAGWANFLSRKRSNGILKMSHQGLAPRPKESKWRWLIDIGIKLSLLHLQPIRGKTLGKHIENLLAIPWDFNQRLELSPSKIEGEESDFWFGQQQLKLWISSIWFAIFYPSSKGWQFGKVGGK